MTERRERKTGSQEFNAAAAGPGRARYALRPRSKGTPAVKDTKNDGKDTKRKQPVSSATGSTKRKGVSKRAFPPFHEQDFGIIQSIIYREPFWLLVAVMLLNQTAGKSARPIFWKLKKQYPDPDSLATADQGDVETMIHSLGLQSQRSRRMIKLAQAWAANPPQKGMLYRTKNYPRRGDGLDIGERIEGDTVDCTGALEIGHLPGCGPYAWDSWRIFCRDILRGVADDYNGMNAEQGFEPEWKRVLPQDKELRACLGWMWLREGWLWDPETGRRRRTS